MQGSTERAPSTPTTYVFSSGWTRGCTRGRATSESGDGDNKLEDEEDEDEEDEEDEERDRRRFVEGRKRLLLLFDFGSEKKKE